MREQVWATCKWDEIYGKRKLQGYKNYRRLPGGGDLKLGLEEWVRLDVKK